MKTLFAFLLFIQGLCPLLPAEVIDLDPELFCFVSDDAVYEWRTGQLKPRRGLFSYYSGSERPLKPDLIYTRQVERGQVLSILVSCSSRLSNVSAVLSAASSGIQLRSQGVSLGSAGGYRSWVLLLGLPSYLEAGVYTLSVTGTAGNRWFQALDSVELLHRSFAFERIPFSEDLTDLMTRDIARRVEESRRLRQIIEHFDPEAIFHQGSFELPVNAVRRSANYGDRREYRYADGGSSFSLHNGLDLAAPVGEIVSSCAAGRVVLATARLITGYTVVLEHLPGVYSLYYHLDTITVREGDLLEQGQMLGTVGMTGLATGPHLHWELRVSGAAVDPEPYLRRAILDVHYLSNLMRELKALR